MPRFCNASPVAVASSSSAGHATGATTTDLAGAGGLSVATGVRGRRRNRAGGIRLDASRHRTNPAAAGGREEDVDGVANVQEVGERGDSASVPSKGTGTTTTGGGDVEGDGEGTATPAAAATAEAGRGPAHQPLTVAAGGTDTPATPAPPRTKTPSFRRRRHRPVSRRNMFLSGVVEDDDDKDGDGGGCCSSLSPKKEGREGAPAPAGDGDVEGGGGGDRRGREVGEPQSKPQPQNPPGTESSPAASSTAAVASPTAAAAAPGDLDRGRRCGGASKGVVVPDADEPADDRKSHHRTALSSSDGQRGEHEHKHKHKHPHPHPHRHCGRVADGAPAETEAEHDREWADAKARAVEKREEDLRSREEALRSRAEVLAEREVRIARTESDLARRAQNLEAQLASAESALERRERTLAQREADFLNTVRARTDELDGRERTLRDNLATVEEEIERQSGERRILEGRERDLTEREAALTRNTAAARAQVELWKAAVRENVEKQRRDLEEQRRDVERRRREVEEKEWMLRERAGAGAGEWLSSQRQQQLQLVRSHGGMEGESKEAPPPHSPEARRVSREDCVAGAIAPSPAPGGKRDKSRLKELYSPGRNKRNRRASASTTECSGRSDGRPNAARDHGPHGQQLVTTGNGPVRVRTYTGHHPGHHGVHSTDHPTADFAFANDRDRIAHAMRFTPNDDNRLPPPGDVKQIDTEEVVSSSMRCDGARPCPPAADAATGVGCGGGRPMVDGRGKFGDHPKPPDPRRVSRGVHHPDPGGSSSAGLARSMPPPIKHENVCSLQVPSSSFPPNGNDEHICSLQRSSGGCGIGAWVGAGGPRNSKKRKKNKMTTKRRPPPRTVIAIDSSDSSGSEYSY